MLLVVATNPSVDRTLDLPRLVPGQVHRALSVRLGAGGKGLNVARAARTLGVPCLATGFLAGHTGRLVADLARAEGLEADWHLLGSGETRNCHLINHPGGDATVINEPGSAVPEAEWAAFEAHLDRLAADARAVALAGSLPPALDAEVYAALCRRLARRVGRVYVDSSTQHLGAVVGHPAGLVIKVNRAELAGAVGRPLDEPGRMVAECRALVGAGAEAVVVTLGAAGALGANRDGAWRVAGPEVRLVSSVGSGDSFLAGMAAAALAGRPFPETLAWGAACGAANASTELPASFTRQDAERLLALCRVEPV